MKALFVQKSNIHVNSPEISELWYVYSGRGSHCHNCTHGKTDKPLVPFPLLSMSHCMGDISLHPISHRDT